MNGLRRALQNYLLGGVDRLSARMYCVASDFYDVPRRAAGRSMQRTTTGADTFYHRLSATAHVSSVFGNMEIKACIHTNSFSHPVCRMLLICLVCRKLDAPQRAPLQLLRYLDNRLLSCGVFYTPRGILL